MSNNLRSTAHNPRGDGDGRQNTSDAVMAQRGVDKNGPDDFPTPPWGTRALLTHVIAVGSHETVLEPAANRGYMSEVLKEGGPSAIERCAREWSAKNHDSERGIPPIGWNGVAVSFHANSANNYLKAMQVAGVAVPDFITRVGRPFLKVHGWNV